MDKLEYQGEMELLQLRLGPYNNNAYVVVESATRRAAIIDAPMEGERLLDLVRGLKVEKILLTHGHPDHIASLQLLREATGARVYAHPAESNIPASQVDEYVSDGQLIAIGNLRLEVIATPGHTEGGICFYGGPHLFCGDTLFPGGPGYSRGPEDLRREIQSIVERLYPLPPDTLVNPGHGEGTTIEQSKAEYSVFAAKRHPPDLCGNVLWAES